jgi:hypothetical protein
MQGGEIEVELGELADIERYRPTFEILTHY